MTARTTWTAPCLPLMEGVATSCSLSSSETPAWLILQLRLQGSIGIINCKDNICLTIVPRSMFPSIILSVEILSGQHVPRPHGVDEGEVIDPYVEVENTYISLHWVINFWLNITFYLRSKSEATLMTTMNPTTTKKLSLFAIMGLTPLGNSHLSST